MSTYILHFMFPITGTKGTRPNRVKHPHTMMLPPPNFKVNTQEAFAGHPLNSDGSIGLPGSKKQDIHHSKKNIFTHIHSPMMVSFALMHSTLSILSNDVQFVNGCMTILLSLTSRCQFHTND
ncbi:hypothetical protein TNCV_1319391 [Trichonephila clavipes]|nr:hypothetical protein TNCV_1319391 [Trichonephila clavipes]